MARAKRPLEDEESYVAQTPPMNDPANWIDSGSLALNAAIGWGYPRGHITEIYGPSQSRKSSLLLLAIARAQERDDMRACWYAGEDGLPEGVADLAGVNLRELRYKHVDTVEKLFNRAGNFSRKAKEDGKYPLWAIDSMSSLTCNDELYAKAGQKFTRPPTAKAITLGWRRGSHTLRTCKATSFVISHEKDGYVPGGRSTGFYSSVRIWTRLMQPTKAQKEVGEDPGIIKNVHGEQVGVRLIVDVIKTRFGPLQSIPVFFYYDRGFPIDPMWDMKSFLRTQGLMVKKGAYLSIEPYFNKSFYDKDWAEFYHARGKDFWDELVLNFATKRYASICEKRGITAEQHEQMYREFKEKQEKEAERELEEIMAMQDPEKRGPGPVNNTEPAGMGPSVSDAKPIEDGDTTGSVDWSALS